jgi:AraC-like DNA-binding protein
MPIPQQRALPDYPSLEAIFKTGRLPPAFAGKLPEPRPHPPWLAYDSKGEPMAHPADIPLAALAGDHVSPMFQRFRLSTWTVGIHVMRGEWAIEFPIFPGGYLACLEGSMLVMPAEGAHLTLAAGDYVLVQPTTQLRIGTSAGARARPIYEIHPLEDLKNSRGIEFGQGAITTRFTGGPLLADQGVVGQLRSSLPAIFAVKVSSQSGESLVPSTLRLIESETKALQPGSHAIIGQLASILYIEGVRQFIAGEHPKSGWVRALLDHQLGPVLAMLHAMPARDWTLDDMAAEAGISRTALHERFIALIGEPPATYLRNHRMTAAAELLRGSSSTVQAIARRVGYESNGAFSSAFLRWAGCTPMEYRKQAHNATPPRV